MLVNTLTHLQAQAVQPRQRSVPWRCLQWLRRRIVAAIAHIACSANALPPEPQFIVKTKRVAVAVRLLQAHRHAPALPWGGADAACCRRVFGITKGSFVC